MLPKKSLLDTAARIMLELFVFLYFMTLLAYVLPEEVILLLLLALLVYLRAQYLHVGSFRIQFP